MPYGKAAQRRSNRTKLKHKLQLRIKTVDCRLPVAALLQPRVQDRLGFQSRKPTKGNCLECPSGMDWTIAGQIFTWVLVSDSLLVPLAGSPLGLRTTSLVHPIQGTLSAGLVLNLVVQSLLDLTPSRRDNQSD